MSIAADSVKRSLLKMRASGKLIFYVVLIMIQATAAAFAAAKSHKGADPTSAVILLALAITIAAGIRELVREVTGPDYKAGKEVRKAHHLLTFMSNRFPALMSKLTGALIAKTAESRSENLVALQNDVLTVTSNLIPQASLRVAVFWAHGTDFEASPYFFGWDQKPLCPRKGVDAVIRATLDDETCLKAYSEDVELEKSVHALAFRFSDTCQSFVAVPIRCPEGLAGFLHVECDQKKMLDQRAASVIVALSQLLSAAVTLERQSLLPGTST